MLTQLVNADVEYVFAKKTYRFNMAWKIWWHFSTLWRNPPPPPKKKKKIPKPTCTVGRFIEIWKMSTQQTQFCLLWGQGLHKSCFLPVRGDKAINLTQKLHCCRGACQISKRCDNSNYQSRGFETSGDLTIKRIIGYWNGVQKPNIPFDFHDINETSWLWLYCVKKYIWINF